ncbi:hypothetical protein [Embleya sp. NPDC059237]|uniref:hypothetical protein n=1 Tax=Embleya sp. NPDC059237 TaxID=3346784 RepID=UPI0036C11C78
MTEPIRIDITQQTPHGIMWLAGVRHVDLTKHCLQVFGQPDRHNVYNTRHQQTVYLPTDNPPLAFYLCALPIPWAWNRNAHLAFEPAPGNDWEGNALVPGLTVSLTGARPITGWGEHDIPSDDPHRKSWLHRTCRNYQFAWWLRRNRNAPDAPPPRYATSAFPGQLSIE